MTLRTQLALFTALSVAAAVIVVSLVAYFVTRDRLRSEVDASLRSRAQLVASAPTLPRRAPGDRGGQILFRRDPFAEADTYFQVINADGAFVAGLDGQDVTIPIGEGDVAVANGQRQSFMHDARTDDGAHLRVITSPGAPGEAVQIARSLAEVDESLAGLRRVLFGVSGAGIVFAAAFGLLTAQRSLRPVARLIAAAEHVAATQQLDATIEVQHNDEIGRLAASFNEMLRALHESRLQQHQLVSDASHELRTPLTSLRTNIEVLIRDDGMPEDERKELVRDVTFEMEELTKLISELVELASDKRSDAQAFEDIRLDQLARNVAERAARRSGFTIDVHAEPVLVVGNYSLLERAAANLLDNACKWSPAGATIDVSVGAGTFTVRDRGPGVPESDLPHVFDRFYRADAARAKPGSGLGLAIVKQIIEAHGGTGWVRPADGGGIEAGFNIPAVPFEADAAPLA